MEFAGRREEGDGEEGGVGELGGDPGAEEVAVGEIGLEDGQFFHTAGGVGLGGVIGGMAEVFDVGVEVVADDGFFDVALGFDDELDKDLCILLAHETDKQSSVRTSPIAEAQVTQGNLNFSSVCAFRDL